VLRLHDPTEGQIKFDGKDISTVEGSGLKNFRREAQMIHQDPYESLNPRFSVHRWIREPLNIHGVGTAEERDARVYELLERVGLHPPGTIAEKRPTELSGGQRQRVSIARALSLDPSFLLADEPVSMLDVSIRANILELFNDLQQNLGLTALYISHDLSMLRHLCDRIGIMYLGQLVEVGPADDIISDPKHPYTQALVDSVPRIDPTVKRERVNLPGDVPDPMNIPSGCRFHPRCPEVITGECDAGEIPEVGFDDDRWTKCVLYED
jgi:peptide/nickel transport system ATP-binding protein